MLVKPKVIAKLKDGSEEAFNEVYYAYDQLIYYIVFSLVNNKQTSEDLMQEIFIKMYKHIHTLIENDKFHSWFIKLAKNNVYNFLKKENNKNHIELVDLENHPEPTPIKFDFNHMLDDFENQVITLHFVYHLTFKEISEDTGKSMSIVTKAYYKALKKLKKEEWI